jgi:hypothetical protein
MAHYFNTENAKALRYAPDYLNITIKVSGTTIMTLTRENIISCTLVLQGVELKLDNPELRASTIEIEAYWPGDNNSLERFRGKSTVIVYQSGYADGERSKTRTFYSTFDEDGLTLNNHVLKIKGTDKTGTVTGQLENVVTTSPRSETIGGQPYGNLKYVINAYLTKLCSVFGYNYDNSESPRYAPDYKFWLGGSYSGCQSIFIRNKSYRKAIAQFCSFFRGEHPTSPLTFDAKTYKRRFVYRDAGRPFVMWLPDGVSPKGNSGEDIVQWPISYDEVGDLNVIYGNAVKEVQIQNYNLLANPSKRYNGTIEANRSAFLKFEDDIISRVTGYGSISAAYLLDAKTVKITNSGSAATNYYIDYDSLYISDESTTQKITSGLSDGDVIKLEPFEGLWYMESRGQESSSSGITPITTAIDRVLGQCNLRQPKWIEFTWRGHPDMQPNDIIIFTEKNGRQNYYEIDNLTLEHKDGGLTSRVKAIYKFAV